MARILLLLVLLPLLELYVLFQIGARVGFFPTVLGVLVVGFAGAALARHRAGRVWQQWREALAEGRPPSEGLADALLLLLAGALLILPGVISDVLGLALLVPAVRRYAADALQRSMEARIARGSVRVYGVPMSGMPGAGVPGARSQRPAPRPGVPAVIDVEGELIEQDGKRLIR